MAQAAIVTRATVPFVIVVPTSPFVPQVCLTMGTITISAPAHLPARDKGVHASYSFDTQLLIFDGRANTPQSVDIFFGVPSLVRFRFVRKNETFTLIVPECLHGNFEHPCRCADGVEGGEYFVIGKGLSRCHAQGRFKLSFSGNIQHLQPRNSASQRINEDCQEICQSELSAVSAISTWKRGSWLP